MGSEDFVMKVYESEFEGNSGKEVLQQTRREGWDRERCRLFCHAHLLGELSLRE